MTDNLAILRAPSSLELLKLEIAKYSLNLRLVDINFRFEHIVGLRVFYMLHAVTYAVVRLQSMVDLATVLGSSIAN